MSNDRFDRWVREIKGLLILLTVLALGLIVLGAYMLGRTGGPAPVLF